MPSPQPQQPSTPPGGDPGPDTEALSASGSRLPRDLGRLPLSGGGAAVADGAPPDFPGLLILDDAAPGAGGMGVVYKARELSLDRVVAVKTVRAHLRTPAGREFFLREARAAASLDHPNILRIHRFDPEHAPPFYVMQYVEGRPLAQACQGRDARFVAAVVEKVARALAYAHGRGVVHRDIKPDNILVDFDNEPHVVDFGLAGRLEEAAAEQGGDGGRPTVFGTPGFIAPEVYAGDAPAGPAADVYALGVTLYQLLTGRLPFAGRGLDDVRRAVLETEPPLPQELNPAVPEPLQRVCLKAMERDPAARYASAAAMAEDLRRFLDGREVSARPTRYAAEVRGRLQNHLTEIRAWHEQNLIDVMEMDRLARPYRAILDVVSPWAQLSKQFPWETLALRLGGWLVLVSSVLWPAFYWEQLTRTQRVLAVGLPALAINLVGWVLFARRSRVNALIYLTTGALLLPLAVATLLSEYGVLSRAQAAEWELFHHPPPDESDAALDPTNLQLTLAAAAFLGYSLLLLAATRAKLLAVFVGSGVYGVYAGLMLLAGMRYWVEHEQVARAALAWLALAVAFWPLSAALNRHPRLREYAGTFFAFFPLPFVAFLNLLARYGGAEWLGADPAWDSETINLWVMANGVAVFAAAWWACYSRSGAFRFWGVLLMVLVPVHLLTPTHQLFERRPLPWDIGGQPVTAYELAAGVVALGLSVLATRSRLHALALPALLGVATFIYRATGRHFHDYLAWPLALATVGAAAMAVALVVLIVRSRRRHGA